MHQCINLHFQSIETNQDSQYEMPNEVYSWGCASTKTLENDLDSLIYNELSEYSS